MMRILVVLLLLIPVTALPFQNEPNGFRAITWGSPVGKIAGLRPAGDAVGTVRRYLKMDETLLFEGVQLSDISYVADQDKFVGVDLLFDCVQRGNMFKALTMNYGAATKGKAMTWQGTVTTVTLNPPAAAQTGKASPDAEPPLCSLTIGSTAYLMKTAVQPKGK